MAYVVTEPCIGTKDRACVEVCPVDCFYNFDSQELNTRVGKPAPRPGDNGMLVINPDECIHCSACEPECPVNAIFEDSEVADETWSELNKKTCEAMSAEELDAARVTSKA